MVTMGIQHNVLKQSRALILHMQDFRVSMVLGDWETFSSKCELVPTLEEW
jgi:hypothetical protein